MFVNSVVFVLLYPERDITYSYRILQKQILGLNNVYKMFQFRTQRSEVKNILERCIQEILCLGGTVWDTFSRVLKHSFGCSVRRVGFSYKILWKYSSDIKSYSEREKFTWYLFKMNKFKMNFISKTLNQSYEFSKIRLKSFYLKIE